MLQPSYTQGELRLLEAADLVEHSPTFYMHQWMHDCDTPACVLGHYALAHPADWCVTPNGIPLLHKGSLIEPSSDAELYFGLSSEDAEVIFGPLGCNNAKTGAEAAAFIRNFVARRFAARLTAEAA